MSCTEFKSLASHDYNMKNSTCEHGVEFIKTCKDCDALMEVEVHSLRDDPNYVKCERCWNYHTCKMNFMQCCDRCCSALLELDDSIVAPHFKEEIRESYRKQAEFYEKK